MADDRAVAAALAALMTLDEEVRREVCRTILKMDTGKPLMNSAEGVKKGEEYNRDHR